MLEINRQADVLNTQYYFLLRNSIIYLYHNAADNERSYSQVCEIRSMSMKGGRKNLSFRVVRALFDIHNLFEGGYRLEMMRLV